MGLNMPTASCDAHRAHQPTDDTPQTMVKEVFDLQESAVRLLKN